MLIMKPGAVGISGYLLCWCSSFRSNRFQRVVVGDWMPVLSGIPQGQVLGPLFFIIYINDLIISIQIPIKVNADDMKLIFPCNKHIQCVALQNALDIHF